MVGEFPELQGMMGRYYALHDGEADAVADAIEDHYRPRFAGDALPRNAGRRVVALADKLETLAGMFGIGQLPTGDKDPFALRRHALGVIRMLIERQPAARPARRSLGARRFAAVRASAATPAQRRRPRCSSLHLRAPARLPARAGLQRRTRSTRCSATRPAALGRGAEAAGRGARFAALPEAAALAAANKRIGNILKKATRGRSRHGRRGAAAASRPRRRSYAALRSVAPLADAALRRRRLHRRRCETLAALRAPVDAFFDDVMVNADDPALRANRLALLARLHAAMNRVADLSRLASLTTGRSRA